MEFNKYIQSNTLDLHELNSINVPKLLELLKKNKVLYRLIWAGIVLMTKNAEKLFRQRGLVIMANCHEEENPGIRFITFNRFLKFLYLHHLELAHSKKCFR